MNLLIDIGNTRVKAALWEGSKVKVYTQDPPWEEILAFGPAKSIVSSVKSNTDELLGILQGAGLTPLHLQPSTPLPIFVDYQTPETLGMDRVAAAVGAQFLCPGKTLLVVNMGTCITMDLVRNNTFAGGSISPGIAMRLQAMHSFTDKLPRLEMERPQDGYPGKNTRDSMLAGAVEGALLEIESRILRLVKDYPDLHVFIAGGDHRMFESSVNSPIFVNPDLIFVGLERILEYNV
ncbi:MAG: type III pantothenate kinase [Cytophagaceae bacterium]|jgi:type III pantothenate kinase|nr:type III pantothenate kinase [Cytophagaceae bacterium]